jgi:hypothetical protein
MLDWENQNQAQKKRINKPYSFKLSSYFNDLFCQMYNKYIAKLKIIKFNNLNNCFDRLKQKLFQISLFFIAKKLNDSKINYKSAMKK